MKKQILFFFLLGNLAIAQNVTFEDPNFKGAIIKTYPSVDANGDNEISYEEAATLTQMRNLSLVNYQKITSAVGIEAFVNLTELNLRQNEIVSIDLSANTKIKTLNLRENKLTGTLDLSAQVEMTNLELNTNEITSLQLPESGLLSILYCNDNSLTNIDLSKQSELKRLFLVRNGIAALDLSHNLILERLQLDENQLAEINLSGLTKLNWLSITKNGMQNIIFNNNPALKSLLLNDNNLQEINFEDEVQNNVTLLNVSNNPNFTVVYIDCEIDSVSGVTPSEIEIIDNCTTLQASDSINNTVKIVQNPFTEILEFSVDVRNVEVYDFSGRKVFSSSSVAKKINVSNLKAGTYLVKFNTKDKLRTATVVKK